MWEFCQEYKDKYTAWDQSCQLHHQHRYGPMGDDEIPNWYGKIIEGVYQFRKKPVVIYAMRYDGQNASEVLDWIGPVSYIGGHGRLAIETLEGEMTVSAGDWVIKGVQGEFYPCKADIFAATYERV